MIKINKQRLKNAFYVRDYNLRDASKKLGRHPQYLSNCAHHGEMGAQSVYDIEEVFGIKPTEYIGDEVDDPAVVVDGKNVDKFFEKLYDTVFNATYNAVKKAWEND